MVNPSSAESDVRESSPPWYRQLNGYHWLVLVVATLAWAFDCLSQQIFNLTRKPAMDALAGSPARAEFAAPLSTTALLVGWATGGIVFGILGDRIGRAKTMTIMIVCYSLSTGLCGLSLGPWDYIFYCFITGFGAGGIFPISCTLVAESLPDRARTPALGMVQTFSAVGNMGAGFISLGFVALLTGRAISSIWPDAISSHWRWMFSVGIVPSLLAVIVARRLREPEAWQRAVAAGTTKKAGLRELVAEARWRRNAIVGMLLAASGVVGLWGIGVFSNDLTQRFVGSDFDQAQRASGEAAKDLQFVGLAIRSSESVDRAKSSRVQPRQLLGLAPLDKDAERAYKAALDLAAGGKQVTPARVLAAISGAGEKPLSTFAAAALSDMAATGDSSIEDHARRILARQKARNNKVLTWAAWTLICFNFGAFFGMYAFARVTQWLGRRPTFAIFFLLAMFATAFAFRNMAKMPQDLWMVALMGAAQLSVFGGYAIYFPELFPTRLRSTGASFCYNVGRYVSALGPLSLALFMPRLVSKLGDQAASRGDGIVTFAHFLVGVSKLDDPTTTASRVAGIAMCACYLVGLAALLFAPETKGQPLPE